MILITELKILKTKYEIFKTFMSLPVEKIEFINALIIKANSGSENKI